jgi:AraC family transcriptional regulator, regulatory protein of adaptative response / methylated-DNA-[protein]-cysteine methyltransferase
MDLFTDEVMYNAVVDSDSSFDGLFFLAVITTGIFCRPSCRARNPKKKNVEFFRSAKEALANGYRPCKICNPLEYPDQTPAEIRKLIDEVTADPSLNLKEQDLRDRGVEPDRVRRWFQKHHGLTFHTYQRMLRLNTAFKKIQNGETVTKAAFETGYDSLSGFQDSFKSVFGISPSESRNNRIIDVSRIETPLGPMIAGAIDEQLCLLEFTSRRMLESEFRDLSERLDAIPVQGKSRIFTELANQLDCYFDGTLKNFQIPLKTPGTEFQEKVWNQLQKIPYGETCSYLDQAKAIGKPKAVRAVANANGMNRIAIIIPCHRVIGTDGKLTGYGGGLWRKKYLLDLESRYV